MTTKHLPEQYTQQTEEKLNVMEMPMMNGTDIYLSAVSCFLTAAIVHTCANLFMMAHSLTFHCNILYSLMAISSLLAGHNALTNRNQRFFRQRVVNAVCASINLVFISPFTIPIQIGQSISNGFMITRNLFD